MKQSNTRALLLSPWLKKMKSRKIQAISGFFVFCLIFWQIFLPRDFNSKRDFIFKIEKGEGSGEIALNLEKEKLIWQGTVFQVYVFFAGKADKLQAGYYFLSPSMNMPKIIEKLASGSIAKAKITIPEGFAAEQIHARLENLTKSDIVKLKEHEGYLFPDTYEIVYGTKLEKIIEMMMDNFNRKTAGLEITPEIVIMASILEKEVKLKEEKELAAGVLWKRLKARMPLQVDAYKWTYENYGLPEKPISNPGIESIKAAIMPKESPYWYYLSKPDGETIFQKTLEEHNYAKIKYLK